MSAPSLPPPSSPPSSSTSQNQIYSVSSLIHTTPPPIQSLLTDHLPILLNATATSSFADNAVPRHVFVCYSETRKSNSGKPTRTPLMFSLRLTVEPSTTPSSTAPSSTTAPFSATSTVITIATVSDALAPQPVPVSGLIILTPEAHNTTQLTIELTNQNSVAPPFPKTARKKTTRTLLTRHIARHTLPRITAHALSQTTDALSHLLSLGPALHKRFARYDAVDQARYDSFEAGIPHAQPVDAYEAELLATAADETSGFKRFAGTVRSPVAYFHKTTNNATWGKAVANIDASAASVFSYSYCVGSYLSLHDHVRHEGPDALRKFIAIPDSHSVILANVVRLGIAVSDRLFVTRFVWQAEPDGSFLIAFAPLASDASYAAEIASLVADSARASKAVLASTSGFWRFVPLAPTVCEVTYVARVQLGGSIPTELVALKKLLTLRIMQKTQEKYERNGKLVDDEMRLSFPLPPPFAQLADAQKQILDNCRYLESHDDSWETLASPSPFVAMWSERAPASMIALGKATAIIDCSARDALAFFFAVGAREDRRISSEQGNPALLVQRRTASNDMVWATIKKMPFPLHNREFVVRQVCCSDVNGDFLVVAVSTDDVIDYGMKTNTVRGVSRALTRFAPSGESRCKVTHHMYLDANGRIPAFVVNAKLPLALGILGDLRKEFQRDDEIDKLERDQLARVIKDEQQVYSQDEDSLIHRVQNKLGALKEPDFEELESPDMLVKMALNMKGETAGVARATTVVDADIEECAPWEMAKLSREQLKKPALLKTLTAVNSHHRVYHTVVDHVRVPGFSPREFVSRQVWQRQDAETFLVAYESFANADYPTRSEYVRGYSRTLFEYVKLPAVSGVPQTRVTFTSEIDMGGIIPKVAQKIGSSKVLRSLSVMRKRFDKSLEVDGATRALNVAMITGREEEYSSHENWFVAQGEKHFADFQGQKSKSLEMKSPLTTAKIAYERGDRHVWGYAKTTVLASPTEVLAFFWDSSRRTDLKNDDLEKAVVEQANGHNVLIYRKKRGPKIISSRDFLGRVVWKAKGRGFVLVTSPEENALRPITDGAQRGKYPSAMRIARKNESETVLELVFQINFGGSLPTLLTNTYVGASAGAVTEVQEYFQSLRGLDEWGADDARAVGEVICMKTMAEKYHEKGESKKGSRVLELFKEFKGLGEIGRKYEFMQPLITRVVENKIRTVGDVKSKLCSVTAKEGRKIGAGLALALASHLTAEAGVNEWIDRYSCLGELDRTEAWFRPMLNVVAKRLLGEVSWGLKMRVIMGAGLSTLDMTTDIYVLVGYLGDEKTRGYGWGLLGMVAGSMVLQLLVVYGQNSKKPKVLMKEFLIVLTCMKPAVDSYRVSSGTPMEAHHVCDAKSELVFSKCAEMVAESIPGSLLQSYVLLKRREIISVSTVGSLVVSAMTTGFISASISFDYDVDPDARKSSPDFYGFIPDGGSRTVIFGCMMLNSALLLLIRSFSAAMLMLVKKRYFVLLVAGDMALYLLQKLVRGDFQYWIPIDGALGLFMSLLIRVLIKTLTDFTGVIQMRHDGELGGLYWTVNMFVALLASFACVWIGEGGRTELVLVGAASVVWILVFGLFLLLMKKEYRGTFYCTRTGNQRAMGYFLDGKTDETKAVVLTHNKKQWRAIREDVKEWVQANWWRWEEEKPEWYSLAWQSQVPKDWIDNADEGGREERGMSSGRGSFQLIKGVLLGKGSSGRVYAEGPHK